MKKKSIIFISAIVLILLLGVFILFKMNKYTVTFYSEDNIVYTIQARKNTVIEEPEAPTKKGYMFLGWYTEDRIRFNFGNAITKDMKLTAYWAEITTDPDLEE